MEKGEIQLDTKPEEAKPKRKFKPSKLHSFLKETFFTNQEEKLSKIKYFREQFKLKNHQFSDYITS